MFPSLKVNLPTGGRERIGIGRDPANSNTRNEGRNTHWLSRPWFGKRGERIPVLIPMHGQREKETVEHQGGTQRV